MPHKLKLVNWFNDGFPPIDLSEQLKPLLDLIKGYKEKEEQLSVMKNAGLKWFDMLEKEKVDNKRLKEALKKIADNYDTFKSDSLRPSLQNKSAISLCAIAKEALKQ